MVFTDCGVEFTTATVASAPGVSNAISLILTVILAKQSMVSARIFMGVVPQCCSRPRSSMLYQLIAALIRQDAVDREHGNACLARL